MYPRILFVVCLLLFTKPVFCQDPFIVFSGTITDATSHRPIPAANIQLKNGHSGTMTNTLGNFTFKIPTHLVADSILISCIGYRTVVRSFSGNSEFVNIGLEPAIIALPEVAVYIPDGLDIIRKAVALIPQNYDTTDTRMTAFYRENIHFNHDTLNYNESVLDIFKTFRRDKTYRDQVRILKGRRRPSPPNNDPQFYNWIGNILNTAYSSLSEDIIKYHDVKNSLLRPQNYRYYQYSLLETITEGGRKLLVIQVLPRGNHRKAILQGRIYIDEATYAIVRLDMETSSRGNEYINRHGKGGIAYIIMSKVVGATLKFTAIRTVLSYKAYKGKYYLHTVQRHWEVAIDSRKRNLREVPWSGDFSLLVTDVSKDSVRQFQTGVADARSSMNYQVSNSYDPAFWEHYNIIQPDLPDTLKTVPQVAVAPLKRVSNRQHGFTRADTLRGQLSPLRSCYDVKFYYLDVTIDTSQRRLSGSNLIRYKVLEPFDRMQIDLYANMRIERILYNGKPLSYTREYDAVYVSFPAMQAAGSTGEMTIYYEGIPQVPDKSIPMNGGLIWDKDEAGNPWVQMVCQGSGASLWWPCKDHLSDEPDSMRICVTLPEGFTEVSNGRLLRKVSVGNGQNRFEWQVSYPINNYNVSFCFGKYLHETDLYVGADSLTIDYYIMPYNKPLFQQLKAQVKTMLACFEKNFGPYAFRRDGFTLVESPYPMEHQSGVCIGKLRKDINMQYPALVWHESAHEWWGNAISCRDIADMWIHEAFATYAEALVIEQMLGKETATIFLNDQRSGVFNKEPVIGEYDVNHIYYEIGDMYGKGSLMLHTFRQVLQNDVLWFDLLRGIQQHYRYQTLSSDSLVSYICRFTKQDYTPFFNQYLKHVHLPRLEYALQQQGKDLIVRYRWKADVPAFNMPVRVTTAAGRMAFIRPATTWKTMTLKNMHADDFEVDEAHFYIDVADTSSGETSFVE
ncbi:carboxypeptidase-like regulatory domain-containing protein [Chitinophaga rhizophila]|uniref:Carboxypeptidase-like regulatory domain-containing protein n=1 Tax=Chitinophaga rhizophila TaxID=2866212 RepID=A0ABS7GFU4_9BACT|nr:carboxypeptidase-like regulatory domain-containing protein [Chitinophaga rhizophila]MBW8685985.1 carboxypeptidase-like regulatory domain-containing protein [Chitinophaga rhizophila]